MNESPFHHVEQIEITQIKRNMTILWNRKISDPRILKTGLLSIINIKNIFGTDRVWFLLTINSRLSLNEGTFSIIKKNQALLYLPVLRLLFPAYYECRAMTFKRYLLIYQLVCRPSVYTRAPYMNTFRK